MFIERVCTHNTKAVFFAYTLLYVIQINIQKLHDLPHFRQ